MRVEELIVLGKGMVHSDFAKMLLADLLNMNSLELMFHLDDVVSSDLVMEYKKRLLLLTEKRPIQYVMGSVNFCGISLNVDERVLIPRFETEELVENVLEYIKDFDKKKIRILDLGCGSGAIGLALKSKLKEKVDVTLVDISSDALNVARDNAKSLGLDVLFIQSDMLDNVDSEFDIIVSNPPYIRDDEEIENIVKENEPHLALYGGKDGLDCYRKILSSCKKNLNSKFLIAFEIGYQQKEDIKKIAESYLSEIDVICKKDLSGKDRMVFIKNKEWDALNN